MIIVPTSAIPNQSLSINLDGNVYDVRIRACNDSGIPGNVVMAFDIAINGTEIVTGTRAVPDFPLIPYGYLENGNFVLATVDGDYADWREFGITQNLVYVSQAELDAIRAAA